MGHIIRKTNMDELDMAIVANYLRITAITGQRMQHTAQHPTTPTSNITRVTNTQERPGARALTTTMPRFYFLAPQHEYGWTNFRSLIPKVKPEVQ